MYKKEVEKSQDTIKQGIIASRRKTDKVWTPETRKGKQGQVGFRESAGHMESVFLLRLILNERETVADTKGKIEILCTLLLTVRRNN